MHFHIYLLPIVTINVIRLKITDKINYYYYWPTGTIIFNVYTFYWLNMMYSEKQHSSVLSVTVLGSKGQQLESQLRQIFWIAELGLVDRCSFVLDLIKSSAWLNCCAMALKEMHRGLDWRANIIRVLHFKARTYGFIMTKFLLNSKT